MTSSNLVGCSKGKSTGLGALEDLVHVGGGATKTLGEVRRVGHEAAGLPNSLAPKMVGELVLLRKVPDEYSVSVVNANRRAS